MSNAIEIEAKVLVSKEDHDKIAALFPNCQSYIQTNYYIDSDKSILHKEGIALRVRKSPEGFTLTLKTPLSEGLLEKNEPLTEPIFEELSKNGAFPEGDTKRFLTMLDIDPAKLKIQASLETKRIDVPYEGGKLSIDENHYSDITDYEIELEYNNEADAERLLQDLLEKHGIPFALNKKTKVNRALTAAGKAK